MKSTSGLCVGGKLPGVVFLMGPTASGKTEIAARLFDQFDCELISVDAAQVFRGMDIGTAKPEPGFLKKYPHHLINICDIESSYSAAKFCEDATEISRQVIDRGKLPVLVGGTLFYFAALEKGMSVLPPASKKIRSQITREIQDKGLAWMHRALSEIDPVIGRRTKNTDSQRIQRAMEIYQLTGLPPSEAMAQSHTSGLPNPIVKIAAFSGDRKILHQRIEKRFLNMLQAGLVEEVRSLFYEKTNLQGQPAMRSVGYRQVLGYLNQEISYDEMIQSGLSATRQLAKRQLTWLRNQSNVVWFDANHRKSADAIIQFIRSHLDLQITI